MTELKADRLSILYSESKTVACISLPMAVGGETAFHK